MLAFGGNIGDFSRGRSSDSVGTLAKKIRFRDKEVKVALRQQNPFGYAPYETLTTRIGGWSMASPTLKPNNFPYSSLDGVRTVIS